MTNKIVLQQFFFLTYILESTTTFEIILRGLLKSFMCFFKKKNEIGVHYHATETYFII